MDITSLITIATQQQVLQYKPILVAHNLLAGSRDRYRSVQGTLSMGAANYKDVWSFVTTLDILQAANWSLESTFSSFTTTQPMTRTSSHFGKLSFHLWHLQTYILIWKQNLSKCDF